MWRHMVGEFENLEGDFENLVGDFENLVGEFEILVGEYEIPLPDDRAHGTRCLDVGYQMERFRVPEAETHGR